MISHSAAKLQAPPSSTFCRGWQSEPGTSNTCCHQTGQSFASDPLSQERVVVDRYLHHILLEVAGVNNEIDCP